MKFGCEADIGQQHQIHVFVEVFVDKTPGSDGGVDLPQVRVANVFDPVYFSLIVIHVVNRSTPLRGQQFRNFAPKLRRRGPVHIARDDFTVFPDEDIARDSQRISAVHLFYNGVIKALIGP